MSWIKRNLIFVVASAIALVCLGLSGWYLYSESNANAESTASLEAAYTDLNRIAGLSPNPGNDKVNNIENAKQYAVQVRAEIEKARKFFVPIKSIPPGTNVSAAEFSGALRRTIDELTRAAENASVNLQPNYDFSFAIEKPQMRFAPGSLEPLASQLGDIKAICGVMFAARVNTLYNIRRVRVCEEDFKGAQSDYLDVSPTTNDLAVLVPYEVTFYGFSGEVASVLAGFANQPHGFIVTTLNIEPGTPATAGANPYGAPNPYAIPDAAPNPENQPAYNPYGRPYNPYNPYGGGMMPQPQGQVAAARPGVPTVVLDEKQLKVTMGISVVKLLPKQ